MSALSPRVVTCNAKKELDPAEAAKVVRTVTEHADVVLWQEIETAGHRQAIKLLDDDWTTWWPGGSANACPISYRHSVFPKVRRQGRSVKTVDGEDGVTPNRHMNDIVLTDRAGISWAFLNTHFISKAWTDNPERRPRWRTQDRRFALRARNLSLRWGRVVAGTDANKSKYRPKGMHAAFAAAGTYGKAFYDGLFYRGQVSIAVFPKALKTLSDHRALVASFRSKR